MAERAPRSLYGSELGNTYKPTRSPEAEPYWAGCREHRLVLPRCRQCSEFHFYPRSFCPLCGAEDLEWCQASGLGEVYTFAVVEQPIEKPFAGLVPYVIAIVELDEGVRMLSRITDMPGDEMRCGLKVEVHFEEVSPSFTIPLFRPKKSEKDARGQ